MKKHEFMNGVNVHEAYVAPMCKVVDIQHEGFLCGSNVIEGSRIENFSEDEYESVWN